MVQESKVVESSLEMRLGHEIPPEHYGILVAIVNSAWGWLFEATPNIIGQRLKSGQIFVAAYSQKQPDEKIEGADLSPYDGQKIPIVFLETVALRTEGNYENVPKDYFSLTNGGLWASSPENPDTVVMVDLTSSPSRRRVTKEVRALIDFTKRLLSGKTGYVLTFNPEGIEHIWTYSPERAGIIKMHTDNGAKDTGFRIDKSRVPLAFVSSLNGIRTVDPLYTHPLMDTHMMSYRG